MTINKAHLTVTADNQSRLYGQTNPTLTQTITGFVNGETVATAGVSGAATASTSASTASGVGVHAINAATGTLNATNYDFAAAKGTLTINKAHLTVTPDDQTRRSGEANPMFTQAISGFVNGETLATAGVGGAAQGSSGATLATPAGQYVIQGSVGSLAAANYDFATATGTLTIKPGIEPPTPPAPSPNLPVTVPIAAPAAPLLPAPDPIANAGPAPVAGLAAAAVTPVNTAAPGPVTAVAAVTANAAAPVAGDAATAGASRGIVVSTSQTPGSRTPDAVAVLVPKALAVGGAGFSFALPADTTAGAASGERPVARLSSGGALPGWLSFDPERRVFTASAVPDGAFPLRVLVEIGGRTLTVTLSAADR
ncbi:MAG: hypothetical protein HY020_19190 [Burkholderiales bacterium]|nr:hypothetical protein [Burkholderiales bacterium]